MKNKIFFVIGVSGAGKTDLVNVALRELQEFDLKRPVSVTTRQPRANEQHGVDFWFVNDFCFQKYIDCDQFLEWEPYGELKHGLLKSSIDDSNLIKEITPSGLSKVLYAMDKDTLKKVRIISVVTDASHIQDRLLKRGMSSTDIEARLASQTADSHYSFRVDRYIYNITDKFEDAKESFVKYLSKELSETSVEFKNFKIKVSHNDFEEESINMIKVVDGCKLYYGDDGKQYGHITVESTDSGESKKYYVSFAAENRGKLEGCSCPAYGLHPYKMCKHMIAVMKKRLIQD